MNNYEEYKKRSLIEAIDNRLAFILDFSRKGVTGELSREANYLFELKNKLEEERSN